MLLLLQIEEAPEEIQTNGSQQDDLEEEMFTMEVVRIPHLFKRTDVEYNNHNRNNFVYVEYEETET